MTQPNPVLREAILEELSRLRAGTIADLPALLTLLRDPLPALRARTLSVIGFVLRDPGDEAAQDIRRTAIESCRERARNDAAENVRVEATRALASWGNREEVIPDLRAIAATDGSQIVRYEAERILFTWNVPAKAP